MTSTPPGPLSGSGPAVPLGTGAEALAFLHRAALALGAVPTSGDGLCQRIGELLREPFPEALVVVASFEPRVSLFHPEAFCGAPEPVVALEALLASSPYGYDIACQDDRWKTLLDTELHAVRGGVSSLSFEQIPRDAGRDFQRSVGLEQAYAMGLVHERTLLGCVALLHPRPLDEVERATVQALVQHASVALMRKRAEDELRAVAGELQRSVGRRTQELADNVTRLALSESRLRALMDAVSGDAVLVDLTGRLLACNQAAAQRLGRACEELVGQHTADLFPPGLVEDRRRRSEEVLETGRAVHYIERLGGRVRDCSLHPVLGADGQIRSFAGFARDITPQSQLEQRLRRAGALQKALFQSVSEGILVLNERGSVVECNRAVLLSFGMERDEMVGRPGVGLCAQLVAWETWEREQQPKLEPDGPPLHFELRMRRVDGSTFMARVGASRVRLQGGDDSIIWVVRDVTDELLRVEQLEYLATHDDLTGLPNRLLFQDRLERARRQCQRYGSGFALLLMDLDGFKEVNDTYGHELGDRLLSALGTRLRGVLRASDTFSRLGGDEFAVLLPTAMPPQQAVEVGTKLIKSLENPFRVGGHELSISASVGVALFPDHDGPRQELLAAADRAMYTAKRAGGARAVLAAEGQLDRS
jgi:diguanylate cyclase (GGDEF)-like protein/PAS domain S-box-containing protein